MKLFLILILLSCSIFGQIKFDDYFLSKTLRVDYFHSGNKTEEWMTYSKLIEEPYWGGSRINLVDTLNLGNFMVKVFDATSGTLIYSRGFSSLFQEWQTTDEAKKVNKTFPESVIIPFPKNKIKLQIDGRDDKNNFVKIWEYDIDPTSYFISKEMKHKFPNMKIHYSGDPAVNYDIVLLAEGYTNDEMEDFIESCNFYGEALFKYEPFKEYKDKINIWAVLSPSKESGSDIPADSVWVNTIMNSSYYTFNSERYVMVEDFQGVRDIAANAPYDQIYILANNDKYGGGAIYNFYSITAIKNAAGEKVFIHELGHGLVGLADEYVDKYTYNEYYKLDVEPWEPNITTLVNFDEKWKYLLDEDVPVPTPNEERYKSRLGVFEGGGYVAKGVYRPTFDSIMNTLASGKFNLPSLLAIKKVLDFYSK
ncbi:MAG: IgA Peptidase M64 [Bacteroidetes bacterium]|nr:IgA Peptidase M64 [Bacteroidota bacterium]